MEIANCKVEDSGNYRCVATNAMGQDETSCVVIVEDRRYVENKSVTRSQESYSSTSIINHTSSSQYQASSTHNQLSSSTHISSRETYSSQSNSMETTNLKRQQKVYGGSATSRSRTATKDLELPPSDSLMCQPQFVKPLSEMTIKDGEALKLTCIVQGDPDPNVTWLKNGELLSSSDILDLKYRNGTATLSINEVYPEDEGLYTCKAKNSLGETETTCRLTVQTSEKACHRTTGKERAPRIIEHVSSKTVNDGESVTLQCRITAATKFDVIWLHNEKEIKPSKDFEYDRLGDVCKLKIAEIFPEDAGTYTCEVFNDVGEAFSSCTLLVVVPNEETKSPTFKVFPQSITVAQGQTAIFKCETDKAPAKVTWMKDGQPLESSTKNAQSVEGKKCFKLEVLNVTTADVGQYGVTVVGKKCETSASFSLNVTATEL